MRKHIALLLALVLIICLCSCSKEEPEEPPRTCGLYITVEASDIYNISCGTEEGSVGFKNADDSPIEAGEIVHFDIGGEKAEGTEENIVDYTICIYDKELNILETKSFSDDFSNLAKIDITVTADHHILRAGDVLTCGGELSVKFTRDESKILSYEMPVVSLPDNAEAQEAVNTKISELYDELFYDIYSEKKAEYDSYMAADSDKKDAEKNDTFTLTRECSIGLGSTDILSLCIKDTTVIGDSSTEKLQGVSFDLETGSVITLSDIAGDVADFTDYVSETLLIATVDDEMFSADDMVFKQGYTELIPTLITDGNWYLSGSGVVFILNPDTIVDASRGAFEYEIEYSELESLLNAEFIPSELEGESGDIAGYNYKDCDLSTLTVVGDEPNAEAEPVMIAVSGNIYNVRVCNVSYSEDGESYTPDSLIWYCSDLSEGAVFAVEHSFSDAFPDLMVSFTAPDGSELTRLLTQSGENGDVIVIDPEATETGTVISGHLPYSVDLNGDGKEEKINSSTDANGKRVISLEADGKTSSFATEIASGLDIRLYNVNADSSIEMFVGGKTSSGERITYCLGYDGTLSVLSFDSAQYVNGSVSEFKNGCVVIEGKYDCLGVYYAKLSYTLGDNGFALSDSAKIVFIDHNCLLTLNRDIELADGSTLNAGESIYLTAALPDGTVYFTSDSGKAGSISLTRSDSTWLINNEEASGFFESLPTA